jgi:hypothetical protein
MRTILHIVTKSADSLAHDLIARQASLPETKIEVADLTQANPDYPRLVTQIFTADSIQVW